MSETVLLPGPPSELGSLRSIVPDFDSVAGWLRDAEAEELFRAAAAVRGGCIVEVGSYRGRSTLVLCAGSSIGAGAPVFAIEPHGEASGVRGGKFGPEDRAEFFRNFLNSGLTRYVRLLNTTSVIASAGWRRSIALLFIDGDHRFASVSADFAAWKPYLIKGATVAFGDLAASGPKTVTQMLVASGTLKPCKRVGRIGLFEYTGRRSSAPRPARHVRAPAAEWRAEDGNYKVGWEHIGYGAYYGGNGSYLYQPVPKCACTTIKTLLLELEGLPVDANVWRRHQKQHNNFPGTSHLPEQEQVDIFEGRTDTFKFVFVRNPYARLASVYCDKVFLRPDSYWINQLRTAAAEQGVTLSSTIEFEEFVAIVSRQQLRDMDPHWRPQYYEGRFETIKFDFVGHVEMMPSDLIYVLERLGAEDSMIKRANEKQNVTGSDVAMWDAVSSEVRKLFVDTYAADFEVSRSPRRLPHPA